MARLKQLFFHNLYMEQLLTKLRAQRANSIPTDSLYVFVAYSVIDYIRWSKVDSEKEGVQDLSRERVRVMS
ncbi:hypothetical protein OSTOST_05799 [Ostertagia ostertagi]